MLSVGCRDVLILEKKTVGVGDNVTLICPRQKLLEIRHLFWTRLVSGTLPEVLGATFVFDDDSFDTTHRITLKQGPETFLLHINKTQQNDTGFYYCMGVQLLNMKLLSGTFLRVKGKHHLYHMKTEWLWI